MGSSLFGGYDREISICGYWVLRRLPGTDMPYISGRVPDHLELILQSTTNKDILNITAYYIIKDAKINKTELYIKPLKEFVLKYETRTIHFDAGQNHQIKF
ncbi:MAG TPA: hypothetical protein VKL21_06085 [Candidatus Methanoperedens sp.]|nr:hypothetical protein [Candidatus Methanoperedens sp.]